MTLCNIKWCYADTCQYNKSLRCTLPQVNLSPDAKCESYKKDVIRETLAAGD